MEVVQDKETEVEDHRVKKETEEVNLLPPERLPELVNSRRSSIYAPVKASKPGHKVFHLQKRCMTGDSGSLSRSRML